MTDLLSLKQAFCDIVQRAQPWILSHFVMWLDLKVAEYKVYGYMVLEQGTSLTSDPKNSSESTARTSSSSSVTSFTTATSDKSNLSASQHTSPRAPCLVVPKPSLSTDRIPTSSSTSSISASTTPIFKHPLFGGRTNRRKQQQVFRRSSASLLTALSSGIYNSVGARDDRRKEEYLGSVGLHPQESDLSISSSVSQSGTPSKHAQGSESVMDLDSPETESHNLSCSSFVSQSVSPSANVATPTKTRRSLNSLFSDLHPEDRSDSGDTETKLKSRLVEAMDDDVQVLSSQYEESSSRSKGDIIVVDEEGDAGQERTTTGLSEDGTSTCDGNSEVDTVKTASTDSVEETEFRSESSGDKDQCSNDNMPPGNDTQCSSSLPVSSTKNDTASSDETSANRNKKSLINKDETQPSSKTQSPSTSTTTHQDSSSTGVNPQLVKEESLLDEIQIKLEPVDTSPNDSFFNSPNYMNQPSSSDSGNLLQQQQFAYSSSSSRSSPGYLEGIDWNAISYNQYLDSSQGFHSGAETSPSSSNQDGRSGRRDVDISPNTQSKSDPNLTCNLCGAVFRFKSSLSRHKTLHGEKRFHCFVCPKAFHRREHLLLHLQRHANSAMITCPVCHMQASSVKHLEEHYRLNHGPFRRTGVPPYLTRDNSR
ncbi:A-agglutinin anchorage subunit-like [Haliotis rubra]|uniref:A-agglutinin anchorage subunit-like n=1 Tax=Haliotis rubra TaxID=36100 RepID=UPI001EE6308A|nr:A-agglutinin anchorage subunit-like [Haliotis rubra]